MILITGASGPNGTEIIRLLSRQTVRVRALTRKQPDLNRPSINNVEFVTADFDDVESIRRALDGVEQAFLVTPSSELPSRSSGNCLECSSECHRPPSPFIRSFCTRLQAAL